MTTKPAVGVGRFASPDTMVSQIRGGVLDLIGAAWPSIAGPLLPRKIESGDIVDIRECIACNVCVTGDHTMTPMPCTQNLTMGEEWRNGWHPAMIPRHTGQDSLLAIGAGPSSLECTRAREHRSRRQVGEALPVERPLELATQSDDFSRQLRIAVALHHGRMGLLAYPRLNDVWTEPTDGSGLPLRADECIEFMGQSPRMLFK